MSKKKLRARWLGTAGLAITYGKDLLFHDPFYSDSPKIKRWDATDQGDPKAILVSHSHFDHVASLGEVYDTYKAPVYGPPLVGENMKTNGASHVPFETPTLGESFQAGPFKLTPYASKHAVFDPTIIALTLHRVFMPWNLPDTIKMLATHRKYPNKDTWSWVIEVDDKKIMVLGSCALDESVDYPGDLDWLFVALQGRSDIDEQAFKITRRLRPDKVAPFHFDNSFPPISTAVPTDGFVNLINENLPDIKVYVPQYDQSFKL